MVLAKPWSSLPVMVKFSELILCPKVLQWPKMGEGSLRCSLYLSTMSVYIPYMNSMLSIM